MACTTAKFPSPLLPLTSPFLPSILPSVFNPAQFARLDETILVISACNGTLLTPITTIKTLLPLGPFQVLINQMAAKRPPPPLSYTHSHAGTHTHLLPSLDRPCGLAKKHIWRNKTSPCWQTNASTLQMKGKRLSAGFSLSHSFHPCDVGIMNATSPLGTVPYWEGLERCPVCSSLIA